MIGRINTNDRMSQIVRFGGFVFLSGQVAQDSAGDIAAQTNSILEKIENLLEQGGSSMSDVLSATIYLADMADFADMNGVWDGRFPSGAAPARTCVEAKLARPDVRVEITVIAADSKAEGSIQ